MALAETHPDMQTGSQEFAKLRAVPNPSPRERGFSFETKEEKIKIGKLTVSATMTTPTEVTDETGLFIWGGYGGTRRAYGKLQNAASSTGLKTAVHKQPRSYTLNPFDIKKLQSQAGWGLIKHMSTDPEGNTINKIDIFAHSWAGPMAASLAALHPERVRNLFLFSSAGFTDTDALELIPGAGRLIWNVGNSFRTGLPIEPTFENVVESVGHFAFNPFRTVGEARVAARSNIVPTLHKLMDKEVRVVIFQAEKDELFDTNIVAPVASQFTDYFHVIPEVGHAAPITDAEIVVGALSEYYRHAATGTMTS